MDQDTNNDVSYQDTSEDNLAVDGLLREFFRHPLGADENYIRRIMNIIEEFGHDDSPDDDKNNEEKQNEPKDKKDNLKNIFKKLFLFY